MDVSNTSEISHKHYQLMQKVDLWFFQHILLDKDRNLPEVSFHTFSLVCIHAFWMLIQTTLMYFRFVSMGTSIDKGMMVWSHWKVRLLTNSISFVCMWCACKLEIFNTNGHQCMKQAWHMWAWCWQPKKKKKKEISNSACYKITSVITYPATHTPSLYTQTGACFYWERCKCGTIQFSQMDTLNMAVLWMSVVDWEMIHVSWCPVCKATL